jgi:hypothetical protein
VVLFRRVRRVLPVQIEFEYSTTSDIATGGTTCRRVGNVWVSACCKADLMLWDEGRQNFVDAKFGGGDA